MNQLIIVRPYYSHTKKTPSKPQLTMYIMQSVQWRTQRNHGNHRFQFQSPQASHLGSEIERVPMLLQIYGFPITCYGLPVPGFPARLRQSCAIVAPRLHQGYIVLAPALHQARGSQIIQNLYPESSRILQIPFGSLRIFILNLLISSRILYQNHPESTEIIKKYLPDFSITI